MKNEIFLCLGKDGVFRERNPEFDVLIHCKNKKESKECEEMLKNLPEMIEKMKELEKENEKLKKILEEKEK